MISSEVKDSIHRPLSELPVVVYTPEPMLQRPFRMLSAILKDVSKGRELAWRLFVRDLSAQYRQTYLGYLWAFLPPLAASLTFIFLNSQGIVRIDTGGFPYPAFVLMGTLLWQVFVDAVANPSEALVKAKPMLAKINFPREAILMSGLYMVVFNFAIRLALLLAVMLWWRVIPGWGGLLFPIAVISLIACGTAVGLAIAPLGALYGDVTKGIPIVSQFWMLLTPVVYPVRTEGLAGLLANWNPISPVIVTARESLTATGFSMVPAFALVSVGAVLASIAGLIGFRIAMPHLIARMGS